MSVILLETYHVGLAVQASELQRTRALRLARQVSTSVVTRVKSDRHARHAVKTF